MSRHSHRGRPISARHGIGSGTALAALRRLRSIHVAAAVVVLVQVPALLCLLWFVPHGLGLLGVGLAAAWTRALLRAADSPYALRPRSRLHLYLGIWPALAFWAACLAFIPLGGLALAVGRLLHVPTEATLGAAALVGAACGVRAIWRTPRVRRVELRFPDLPPALDGFRIAQLSDLHCGPFAEEPRIRSWVQKANRLRPDLVAVTGDLIVSGPTHIAPVARALGELAAASGVFVVMGNHDYFGAGEVLARALGEAGLRLLRNQAVEVRRGDASLWLAGVDDTWTGRADLDATLAHRPPQAFPILLSHDPDLFDEAARRGVALTLSGHTHGGQLAIPFLSRRLNLARLVTRYTAGLYRRGDRLLYVNRGAGTTGPPIRIGARAEITLLTLRRLSGG